MMPPLTHLLLDAARLESAIEEAKEINPAHDSLYRGTADERLTHVAPYLFRYAAGTPFAEWYAGKGWGNAWGVQLKSSWPVPELQKHLRKFILVKTEDGEELYFRFYDPRVLRIFLPTCDAAQVREFFGNAIEYFVLEDEDPAFALKLYHVNGALKSERFPAMSGRGPGPDAPTTGEEEAPPSQQETIVKPQAPIPAPEANIQAKKEPEQAPPAKPNTKWNMFD